MAAVAGMSIAVAQCVSLLHLSIPAGITAAKATSRSMHMFATVFLWDNHLHYKIQSDHRAGQGKGIPASCCPPGWGPLRGVRAGYMGCML